MSTEWAGCCRSFAACLRRPLAQRNVCWNNGWSPVRSRSRARPSTSMKFWSLLKCILRTRRSTTRKTCSKRAWGCCDCGRLVRERAGRHRDPARVLAMNPANKTLLWRPGKRTKRKQVVPVQLLWRTMRRTTMERRSAQLGKRRRRVMRPHGTFSSASSDSGTRSTRATARGCSTRRSRRPFSMDIRSGAAVEVQRRVQGAETTIAAPMTLRTS
mmetsp:Transcript_12635/g.25121  ORF Transcript_12635/g.25121 Transcript_12635/m.25121 type:complete len:214 (+) Transcript_12635:1784-2425(+)